MPYVYSDESDVDRTVEVSRMRWSTAQMIAMLIGIVMLVIGAVALTRAGLDFNNLTDKHVSVAGLHHTAALGIIEVVLGLFLILAGVIPGAARGLLGFLGVLMLAGGIVFIASNNLHDDLGVHDANGWFFIISGAVSMLATALPVHTFASDRRRIDGTVLHH
jgi:hypothetical protein